MTFHRLVFIMKILVSEIMNSCSKAGNNALAVTAVVCQTSFGQENIKKSEMEELLKRACAALIENFKDNFEDIVSGRTPSFSNNAVGEASDEKRLEYVIYTNQGKRMTDEDQVQHYKEHSSLFVDDDKCLVYNKGTLIAELKKSPQGYQLLKIFLENRGWVTTERIFKALCPTKKFERRKINTPISRLRSVLSKYFVPSPEFLCSIDCPDGDRYILDESIDFVLARKKEDD